MILIDPPVSAYSEPDELRAWITELEELRREHAADEGDVRRIDEALSQARGWLERRDSRIS